MRLLLCGFFLAAAVCASAQHPDPAASASAAPLAATGRSIYLSNCAGCHGADGRGGRGPTLAGSSSVQSKSDAQLTTIVKKGIPGSQMPAFGYFQQDELTPLIAFLREMNRSGSNEEKITGDPAHGKAVYAAQRCAMCHQIAGEGSVYAPDLSQIGSARSVAYLRDSIVKPSADIQPEYRGVTVELKTGESISGVRINEDTFSVQIRDISQQFRMFRKDQVRRVTPMRDSLMPAYLQLKPADLNDLLAYLNSLRSGSATGDVKQSEGIR